MAKIVQKFLLPIVSGCVLALAYPGWFFDFGFLAWLGLVPFFIFLERNSGNRKMTFWGGAVSGAFFFGITLRFLWGLFPLSTLGVENDFLGFFLILLIYLITLSVFASFWGVFSVLADFLIPVGKRFKIIGFLGGPALFSTVEYLRSFSLSIVWFGPGGIIGPHWTLSNITYSLSDNTLILLLSSAIGIYGIVFGIVLVNYLLFFLIKKFGKDKFALVNLGLTFLLFLALGFLPFDHQREKEKITVAGIQTAHQSGLTESSDEILGAYEAQVRGILKISEEADSPDLIILPESSNFLTNTSKFLDPGRARGYFSGLFPKKPLIISGEISSDQLGNVFSKATVLDPDKGITASYNKRLLTPAGEFLPYILRPVVFLFPKHLIAQFYLERNMTPGSEEVIFDYNNGIKIKPVICSDIISPKIIRSGDKGLLIYLASNSIFHGSGTLNKQNLAMARFRAAENQKPLFSTSNMGQIYALDASGRLISQVDEPGNGVLTAQLVPNDEKTWYNKFGDWPILIVSGLVLVISVYLRKYRKNGPEN
jgi:apolipoprotein N-acyltransferase